MLPVGPVRMKRRKVPEVQAEAETAEAETAEAETAAAETAATAPSRGVLRKSAIRRFLKQEAPMKVREAFFAALEAKVTADLFRSIARAKEQKRNTLLSSDA
jgi:hypothetical protein